MDVIAYEAPLDNSFQKDRRELVNKGSLGRRRKPSRSNLRLILSPANDRQDIDVFHGQQSVHSDASFVHLNGSNHARESVLDSHQASVSDSNRFENSVERNSYREVVASINQICSLKSVDFNGNRHQSSVKSNNRRNTADVVRSKHLGVSEYNNVNAKYIKQLSVTKNLQTENHRPKSNGHSDIQSNGYHEIGGPKTPRIADSGNRYQVLKISNQQKTVAAKNHVNVITFSNHRQIITSSPVQPPKLAQLNGNHLSSDSYKESSLPRTSKEPNLVAEAQQFSIEAKLRRKKSEVQGRSAVLIQTWERRTQSESYSKLRRDSKSAPKNRFGGKENSDANAAVMPDSYICIKYKGSLQNGDKVHKGELVPSVRGVSPDETMLYRIPDERPRRVHHSSTPTNGGVTVNGSSPVQEPEWISLSKKLCAKFVEGHIEAHSPDSYPYEEPEGVGEAPTPSPQPKTHSSVTPQIQVQKKLLPAPFCDGISPDSEPPWIHLSRKLCNKFIEEHIEYPPITNGHFVEVPDLVEPNGDVRIIEKVGKPKGHKSKQKKESEPEWVSLSKKLRAKFIESHIDDPDTIALDNQLNASDPEETSSETLSDVSHELPVPRKGKSVHREPVECKNFTVRSKVIDHEMAIQEGEKETAHNGSVLFPDKECSWEYQEMEFDQESNSGNFQEYCDEPLQEARVQRGSLPEDDQDQLSERITFSQWENSRSFKIPECYNNDVKFMPYFEDDETSPEDQQHNKLITVQFIARTGNEGRNGRETQNVAPDVGKSTKSGSFFNLSTWDEAHFKEDGNDRQNCRETTLNKKFLSKSLDNLCDSLEERSLIREQNHEKMEEPDSLYFEEDFSAEQQIVVNSRDLVNGEANETFSDEFKPNHESNSEASSLKESAHRASGSMINTESGVLYANSFAHPGSRESVYRSTHDAESSSEDEVFESDNKNKKQAFNDPGEHYGKISPRKSPPIDKEKQLHQVQVDSQKVKHEYCSKNGKDIKCNGMIPNSIYDSFPDNRSSTSKHDLSANKAQNGSKEPVKLGMSKWITMSRSEQNICKPEYSNIQSTLQKDSKNARKSPGSENGSKSKSKKNNNQSKVNHESKTSSGKNISPVNSSRRFEEENAADLDGTEDNSNRFNGLMKECDLKSKCKSMCDISLNSDSPSDGTSFNHHKSVTGICSSRRTPSQIEFQHFEYESEIPLCAKLVSNHNKNMMSKNNTSTQADRADSPSHSESSHVYEDMFKETPSGPSDSEASSWIMKNNTYYINGRSSSMNDLDFSDSCSMSVKCDYASSSENSTLQSRHSSYASSSFYVNLRDYDSHMLEPSLNKGKKTNGKLTNSESSQNISKSNPPTPESLRHLFTSPLSSIHSPPNRAPRLLNRMPSDPQSHYYSTAAATSSAFKHGFAVPPPKPKKTERSSSIKIKDIAHGIILTFKRFQNHSKSSSVRSTQQVDVSHLAEINSHSESSKATKGQKNSKRQDHDKDYYWQENGRAETDSGFLSDVQRAKARRSSSDLTGLKSNSELFNSDKKKSKSSKKNGSKGKKSRSKTSEPRTVPTVSRKVQQMADGTLYLVTTVSGDTALPGVYSDSPDTSSELSTHKPVKLTGESNC